MLQARFHNAWMKCAFLLIASTLLALAGCKQRLNPHVAPEGDPEVVVAGMLASLQNNPAGTGALPSATQRVRLTVNNAPAGYELFEQELIQQLVRIFEQRNPDIQIEFSTWRFTPESFYERARNRTLTDIVEISVDQAQTIIGLSYAADLTDLVAQEELVRQLNPSALALLQKDGRIFGVPVELHSMALFYNRQILEEALRPPSKEQKAPPSKKDEKKKGKGGSDEWNLETIPAPALPQSEQGSGRMVAQFRRSGRSYYDYSQTQTQEEEEQNQPSYSRRAEQQVENEYQVPARRRPIWPFRPLGQQRRIPVFGQPRESDALPDQRTGRPSESEEEIESAVPSRRGFQPETEVDSDIESARPHARQPQLPPPKEVPTSAPAEEVTETVVKEEGTTVVQFAGLPQNWEEFIKLAVKLTDHGKGVYGYAPVLFAQEGGREFVQWGIQAGMEVERQTPSGITLALRSQAATDVLSFLKDLRWRYDVIPPPEKCYADNVMRMFADGKVAMVMLPATRDTIRQLMRMGMPLDNIGIAALPAGPQSRDHLVFGRALIVNSQLEKAKRAAAVRWLLFLLDPEVQRLREQYYFREQELTGIPRVPLYAPPKQSAVNQSLLPYRSIPVFADYEDVVASHIRAEPAHFAHELYEDLAKDVRKVVEQRDLAPASIVPVLALEFEKQFLSNAPATKEGLDRYLRLFSRR
ncbi:MAG: extracellular solute-binding protein [Candidatus Hydrogenedentota bacterium]|jgi:ABC-type glycerol-3-phosphate transport system substrate-binding protein|uniref:Putative sugar-binding lipoprotein n=1 Tax=Sumerlaea chitinivorans TaxID=2250252 RepID=A0A2Z4Y378_SUMC1|nr:putative sugar-binding lipoprotein [Candidatus Sumerlaea chitinivorans]RMH30193.1 MAG: extracellular solute-binding protein [Candidatus Hydrogenedentota bacterium]